MRTSIRPRFRFAELLVATLAVLLLLALIGPLLGQGNAWGNASRVQCTNNLKQLATQAQMFCQENDQRLPGANWVSQMAVPDTMVLRIVQCPETTIVEGTTTYGYNGLLLPATAAMNPDEPGVNEQSILYTTEVGMFADASPGTPTTAPGIIGGGGLLPEARRVSLSARHEGGLIVAFVDGHAKYFPNVAPVPGGIDIYDPVVRAFSSGLNAGIITNYGGGLSDFAAPANLDTAAIIMGGEYCTRPIIAAAMEAWKAKSGAKVVDRAFRGGKYPKTYPAAIWGWADGTEPEGFSVAIGRDAVVVIVAKNTQVDGALNWSADGRAQIDMDTLRTTYAAGASGPYGRGNQWYSYDWYNQTRTFFERKIGYKPADDKGKRRLTVGNDAEMVEKVAQDPYGLGYCSAAMVDPTRVDIVGLVVDEKAYWYPNADATQRWVFPTVEPAEYPLSRTLYAVVTGAAGNAPNRCARVMLAPESTGMAALRKGPVFRTGYYPAK